jgi:hypothetical protein
MIAICPAGPPKLMKPSFSQKRSASTSWGGAGGASGTALLTGEPRRPHAACARFVALLVAMLVALLVARIAARFAARFVASFVASFVVQ